MTDLIDAIRCKSERLCELEAECAALRHELMDAQRAIFAIPRTEPTPLHNSTEMATSVLTDEGRAMHITEMIAAIERKHGVTVRYATLVGNLSRLVKHGRMFKRVGRNTFALLSCAPGDGR